MDSRITLMSSVARLFDLHQTQHTRGLPVNAIISPKQPLPSAGFFLSVGLAIIDTLHILEIARGPGYQSKSKVTESIQKEIPQATDVDIDYCIRFLSQSREINYLIKNDNNEEIITRVSDTSLIEKASEFSQIRLTETARLLFRIDASRDTWLYKDKDVEKILVAVERGLFDDISRFCEDIISSLMEFTLRLTHIEERPTMIKKREEFAELHIYYSETISRAQQAIVKAIALTTIESVRERFRAWAGQSGIEPDMGFVLNDLERVAKAIEMVNRKLMRFVHKVQGVVAPTAGTIKFQDVAYELAMSPQSYAPALARIVMFTPAPIKTSLFHPFDFVGATELGVIVSKEDIVSYFNNDETLHAHANFNNFIQRNLPVIIEMLRDGPVRLSSLITRIGKTIERGETFADFAAMYTFTENNEDYVIKVGLDGSRFKVSLDNLVIHGSNAMLILQNSGEVK
jgi:hypothetical protein